MKQIGELRKISTDIKYLSGNFWFIFCISKQVVQTTRQDILSDNGTIQRNLSQKILTKILESLLVYTV